MTEVVRVSVSAGFRVEQQMVRDAAARSGVRLSYVARDTSAATWCMDAYGEATDITSFLFRIAAVRGVKHVSCTP